MTDPRVSKHFAVLGSPISHSRSPRIHRAAYAELGFDWMYEAIELAEADFEPFFLDRGKQWNGFSVTMPLKRKAYSIASERDTYAEQSGVANTLLGKDGGWAAFNTDIPGIMACVRDLRARGAESATILGAGATALSAGHALLRLGFTNITIAARRPEQAQEAAKHLASLGFGAHVGASSLVGLNAHSSGVLINTLPGDAVASFEFLEIDPSHTALCDLTYDPWPTALSSRWHAAGESCVDGLELLVQQALIQIRIFHHGDPERELPDENRLLEVMRVASMEE